MANAFEIPADFLPAFEAAFTAKFIDVVEATGNCSYRVYADKFGAKAHFFSFLFDVEAAGDYWEAR